MIMVMKCFGGNNTITYTIIVKTAVDLPVPISMCCFCVDDDFHLSFIFAFCLAIMCETYLFLNLIHVCRKQFVYNSLE